MQGPFDAAYFNAVFGNVYDQRDTLLRASLLLRPGLRFQSILRIASSKTCSALHIILTCSYSAGTLEKYLLPLPGGHIVISHPMGRAWHENLREDDAEIVPHALPDSAALSQLTEDLPLRVRDLFEEPDLYLALLQAGVPSSVLSTCPLVILRHADMPFCFGTCMQHSNDFLSIQNLPGISQQPCFAQMSNTPQWTWHPLETTEV